MLSFCLTTMDVYNHTCGLYMYTVHVLHVHVHMYVQYYDSTLYMYMYVRVLFFFNFIFSNTSRSADTVLGEAGDPCELFLVDECDDNPLGSVMGKVNVSS